MQSPSMDEIVVAGTVVRYQLEWDYHEELGWDCSVVAILPYWTAYDENGKEIEDQEILNEIIKYEGL